jgi:hypothetical protein
VEVIVNRGHKIGTKSGHKIGDREGLRGLKWVTTQMGDREGFTGRSPRTRIGDREGLRCPRNLATERDYGRPMQVPGRTQTGDREGFVGRSPRAEIGEVFQNRGAASSRFKSRDSPKDWT